MARQPDFPGPLHADGGRRESGAAYRLVATRAESLGAGAGHDDDTDGVVVMGVVNGVDQLLDRFRAKGVALFRTVDGDPGDAFGGIVENVGIAGLGAARREGGRIWR